MLDIDNVECLFTALTIAADNDGLWLSFFENWSVFLEKGSDFLNNGNFLHDGDSLDLVLPDNS